MLGLCSLASPGPVPDLKHDWTPAECQHSLAILHFTHSWETHPEGSTSLGDLYFRESLFYGAPSEDSAQFCLSLFLWFCCPYYRWEYSDAVLQDTHSSPCLWGTLNLQKKGTKMKLLKQQQPQFTELLLSSTNPVSHKHLQHSSQGHRAGPRACGQDKHNTEQGQINTAQLGAAVKTGPGSIRKSHWNTSSAAQSLSPARWEALCGTHCAFRFINATAPQQH